MTVSEDRGISLADTIKVIESVEPSCEQCKLEHLIGRRRYLCRSCLILVEYRDEIINNIRKASK